MKWQSAILLSLLLGTTLFSQPTGSGTTTVVQNAVLAASCSATHVQAAIDAASVGDTVLVPGGSCTWTSGVTLGKRITLRGAGAGGFAGRSDSSVAIGTGTKAFTVEEERAIVVGETITARYPNRTGSNSMTGTVASNSGGTLTLTVTSSAGSGTYGAWVFERPAGTTITNGSSAGAGSGLLQVTEVTTGNIRITGLHFTAGAGGSVPWHIKITGVASGQPVLVYDNWFTTHDGGAILSDTNRGVVYGNFFNGYYCSISNLGCTPAVSGAVGVKDVTKTAEWATASTMGTADTNGAANFYVEDNVFVAFWQAMTGLDSYARMVLRNNLFVDAVIGSHGAETEDLGVRHWEIYDNTFVQTDRGGDPYNVNNWFNARGGTGVITGNTLDDLNTPGYWGDKPEVTFIIQALQRSLASALSCWGADDPGIQYPAPRQIGFGYVTGAGGNDPLGIYRGDSEPIYIWSNSGTLSVSIQDYGGTECTNPDSTADYFVSGQDYFLNAGAKPSYTRYTYPHPLR